MSRRSLSPPSEPTSSVAEPLAPTINGAAVRVRLLQASLSTWAVGVQVHELFATIGLWLTVVLVLSDLWRRGLLESLRAGLKSWRRLWIFLAWALLGPLLLAGHTPHPDGVGRLLDWLALPAAAYGLGMLSRAQRAPVLVAASATLVVSCLVAGLQHFGLWLSPEALAPLRKFGVPAHRVHETVPGDSSRFFAGGLLLHRLKFSHVTGVLVVFLAMTAFETRGRTRLLAGVAAALGFASILVFAQARGAAVALFIAGGVVLALRGKLRLSRPVVGIVLATSAAIAATPGLRHRLHEMALAPRSARVQLNRAGLISIGREPLSGTGFWRLKVADNSPAGTYPWVRKHPGRAHNQFLTVAAEVGLPGLALLLLFLFALVRRARAAGNTLLAGGLFAYLGLLSMFHDPLFHAEMSMAVMLAFGALVVARGAGPEATA